jgi:transcriptional regulator with XRE-family HTH domain
MTPRLPPELRALRRALGALIQKQRRYRGLTQAELAEIVGISYRTIRAYEQGELLPSLSILLRFADACDMPFSAYISPLDGFELPLREVRRRPKVLP